ncbi:MAG: hypothetical protein BAA01_15525 [Bacillus thermozeamaize]|uniref:Acyl-CoA dehydrogenase n=1 Tax=Bacillus thermozeamaize TaxID=230954 RepID=A0A1Y3PNZ2_9BACI|nr:MAG: hypothetical protein BAA01_15525 [Bacillus thermozeamaize]
MDFSFSQDQKMLRSAVRQWLQQIHSPEQTRRLRENPAGFDEKRWQEIGSLGWLGLNVAEVQGGTGGSTVDAMILFEEMGRALFPSPFLSQWLSLTVLGRFCEEPRKSPLWERLLNGEEIVAFADWEGGNLWDGESGAYRTTIHSRGSEWILTGEKHWVLDGAVADHLLVTARGDDGHPCLVLVPNNAGGVEVIPLQDAARRRMAAIRFHDVVLNQEAMLTTGKMSDLMTGTMSNPAESGEQISWARLWGEFVHLGALAVCAELVGAGAFVLEQAVEHAKKRHQFGRPIGSFQAIQHKCADMWIHLEASRNLLYFAAARWDERHQDASLAVAQAKILVTESVQRVIREGHQIFGGLGYTEEHWMPLYFRFAKEGRALFGMPDEWDRRAAECLLDGRCFPGSLSSSLCSGNHSVQAGPHAM